MKRIFVIAIVCAISGCASPALEVPGARVGQVVSELPPDVPAPPSAEPIATPDAVVAYQRIDGALPDAPDNQKIKRRIADLHRHLGSESGGGASEQSYRDAIVRYESLLAIPGVSNTDDILYHLAESYDLLGDPSMTKRYLDRLIDESPYSDYRLDAHFRRGEIAFSTGNFANAAADYGYVVDQGKSSPFWLNANYMLGWSLLKGSEYEASLDCFFTTIDVISSEGDAVDAATQEMLDDTLRAIVLALSYLDGATTLSEQLEVRHKPVWQYRVYARLASELRDDQRYLDSVAALETFVSQNPYDAQAPQFSQRAIEILTDADFPTEARKHKEAFVEHYRFDGDYWLVNDGALRREFTAIYKTYLLEVAKLAHADAQQKHLPDSYLTAASYYHQYSETFPEDSAASEALFMEGEALTDAAETERAVAVYQRVLHEYPDDARAAEAGYAAILGLDTMLQRAEPERTEFLKRAKIDAEIEYATRFPAASHATDVQISAASALFDMKEYADATRLANRVLLAAASVQPQTRRVALLILAHSAFELAQFEVAEAHYRAVLALDRKPATDASDIRARLLASIFKQAEAAEQRGDIDVAVDNYLRIAADGPNTDIAAQAHFDAVAVYETNDRWGEAADLLRSFRARYPDSALGVDQDTRLADLYERAGRKLDAADEFHAIAQRNSGTEKGRQALYHAAELYLDTNPIRSIDDFRDYANNYVVPLDQALEAAQQLDLLYQRTGDATNQDYWLEKKIQFANQQGDAMTDRARYLAADAQFRLAEKSRHSFDGIELSGDLAKQLAAKRQALQATVSSFERAAEYGVAEFASASTYQIGDTYAALARDLLASTRPAGLTDLEQEQYDLLLEEQALPFEDQAIEIHEINAQRVTQGTYDIWVMKSLAALAALVPARYDRPEVEIGFIDTIE